MADDNDDSGVVQTADNSSLSNQAEQILQKQREDMQNRMPNTGGVVPMPQPRPADAPQAQQQAQPQQPPQNQPNLSPGGFPNAIVTTLGQLGKWLASPASMFDSLVHNPNDPTEGLKAPTAQQMIKAGGESGSGASPDVSPYNGTTMGPRNPSQTAFQPGAGGTVQSGDNTPPQNRDATPVQTTPAGAPSGKTIPGSVEAPGSQPLKEAQGPFHVGQDGRYHPPTEAPPPGQKPQGPSGPMWIPKHGGSSGTIPIIQKENVEPGSQEQHWQRHAQDAAHLPPKYQPEWMNQRYHDESTAETARMLGQLRADTANNRTNALLDLGQAKITSADQWHMLEAQMAAAKIDKMVGPQDKFIIDATMQQLKNAGAWNQQVDLGKIVQDAEAHGLTQQGSSALQMVLSQNAATMQRQEDYNWLKAHPESKQSYDQMHGPGAADNLMRAPNPMVASPPGGGLQGGPGGLSNGQ